MFDRISICPFGMLMPGRKYLANSSSKYRYSFNGQEKESDLNENITAAEFWEYDSRIARRWNPDPLRNTWESPYACFNGNPILYNDPNGKTGIVTIDKESHTITITSTYYFYGNGASAETAKEIGESIQSQWNAAQGTVEIDKQCYSVKFEVKAVYIDVNGHGGLDGRLLAEKIKNNTSYENNYVKISKEPLALGSYTDPVNGKPGGNTGEWQQSDVEGTSTTSESHEHGHGLGAVSAEDGGNKNAHPPENHIGEGQPGIMAERGSMVDAEYTYDPKKGNSKPNLDPKTNEKTKNLNTVNPNKRKVTQKDIEYLHLDKLKFNEKGKANLGAEKLKNEYHP